MKTWFRLAAVLASFGALVPTLRAQDPPGKLLDDFAQRAAIAKQALKSNVDAALARAKKLPPDLALIALEAAESDVRDAAYLTAGERKAYFDQIDQKKKLLGVATSPRPDQTTSTRAPRDNSAAEEHIRNELGAIRALEDQGQLAAANARRKALAQQYPTRPDLAAGSIRGARGDAIRDYEQINAQRNRNVAQARTDTEGLMGKGITGDFVYDPERWAIANKRESVSTPKTTPREKDLLKRLDETTQSDTTFNNTTFEQVLKSLERELGIPLIIGKATMDEVRVGYDSTLTFQMPKGVTKRNLLKSVLGELGLTYIIKAETLQVVSMLQAKNEMRVGYMDVGTLIQARGSADEIIRLIKSQVEPDSWDTGGGNGTITYVAPGTLIIKNTAEVIYRLGARSGK